MQKSAWDDAWGFTQAPALAGCVEDLEEAEALRSACTENEEPNCDAIEQLVQLDDQAAASEGDEEAPVAHITQLYDAHDAAQSEDEEEAEEEQAQAQWCGAGWVRRLKRASERGRQVCSRARRRRIGQRLARGRVHGHAAGAHGAAATRRMPDVSLLPSLPLRSQLSKYEPVLRAAAVTWPALAAAGEDQLVEWGLLAMGPRLRVLAALTAARAALTGAPLPLPAHTLHPSADAGVQPLQLKRVVAAACGPERSIYEFFGGSAPPPAKRPHLPATAAVPPRRAGRAGGNRGSGAQAGAPARARGSGVAYAGAVPPWQAVPGTPFVVDGFTGAAARMSTPSGWFLTHFHSDHYKGLGPRWPSTAPIFCTPSTAALCRLRLRVRPQLLRELPLNERCVIDGVGVTLFDANHCPGAAMILFDPLEPHAPVLHTGDCRWSTELHGPLLAPALGALSGERRARLKLILDTTYCDPAAVFPPASEAAAFVANAVRSEGFNVRRTLFLCGSYTIGKERVAFAAAHAAGARLYAGAAKREVLACLPLAAADAQLLTSEDAHTNVHIVPMACVSFGRMKGILAHYRGRFDTCVGFAPSGWAFGREAARTGGARTRRGSLVKYDVPYSEHSSFAELRDAVAWLKPEAICPSVSNDMGAKCQRMVQLLTAPPGSAMLDAVVALRRPGRGAWKGRKAQATLEL